jgi:NADH-quinone oxidoreductase subunit G
MRGADLSALWVVGANPLKGATVRERRERKAGFLVVQDMFLTETAQQADVVLPAASAYEKNGTVTNVSGEVQRLTRAINTMGAKTDLEIMGFIAREMGAAAALGPWVPETVFEGNPPTCAVTNSHAGAGRRRGGADRAGQRAHSR